MISKELLSEVINIKIEDIIDLKIFGKDLKYYEKCLLNSCCDGRLSNHKYSICKSINIYELAFKCKQYALKRGYILDSQSRSYCKGKGICFIYLDDWTSEFPEYCLESFSADSEIEAIFKACQWILDNKKEGN